MGESLTGARATLWDRSCRWFVMGKEQKFGCRSATRRAENASLYISTKCVIFQSFSGNCIYWESR